MEVRLIFASDVNQWSASDFVREERGEGANCFSEAVIIGEKSQLKCNWCTCFFLSASDP